MWQLNRKSKTKISATFSVAHIPFTNIPFTNIPFNALPTHNVIHRIHTYVYMVLNRGHLVSRTTNRRISDLPCSEKKWCKVGHVFNDSFFQTSRLTIKSHLMQFRSRITVDSLNNYRLCLQSFFLTDISFKNHTSFFVKLSFAWFLDIANMTYKVTTVRGTMTRGIFWSPACATYPYCACVVFILYAYIYAFMHCIDKGGCRMARFQSLIIFF